MVYVGSAEYNVYALNAKAGVLLWSYRTHDGVGCSPAVVDGILYAGSYDDSVYAFGPKKGRNIQH